LKTFIQYDLLSFGAPVGHGHRDSGSKNSKPLRSGRQLIHQPRVALKSDSRSSCEPNARGSFRNAGAAGLWGTKTRPALRRRGLGDPLINVPPNRRRGRTADHLRKSALYIRTDPYRRVLVDAGPAPGHRRRRPARLALTSTGSSASSRRASGASRRSRWARRSTTSRRHQRCRTRSAIRSRLSLLRVERGHLQ
jgi:hypothetical protein